MTKKTIAKKKLTKKTTPIKKEPAKRGAPEFLYDHDQALEICEKIATSVMSIKDLCKLNTNWPKQTTIMKWRIANKDFATLYETAKKDQVENLVDECLEIADNSSNDLITDEFGNTRANTELVQRSKIRIDTRKWLASKLAPRIYGERIAVDNKITISHEDALKEIE